MPPWGFEGCHTVVLNRTLSISFQVTCRWLDWLTGLFVCVLYYIIAYAVKSFMGTVTFLIQGKLSVSLQQASLELLQLLSPPVLTMKTATLRSIDASSLVVWHSLDFGFFVGALLQISRSHAASHMSFKSFCHLQVRVGRANIRSRDTVTLPCIGNCLYNDPQHFREWRWNCNCFKQYKLVESIPQKLGIRDLWPHYLL